MKNEEFDYLIDDEPVTWSELIKRAKEYGYEPTGVIHFTSEAAKILRDNGFEIKKFES